MAMSKAAPKKKAAAPRGRPFKAAEDRRTIMIRVLATEEEHRILQEAADGASMGLSTWIRAAALSMAKHEPT